MARRQPDAVHVAPVQRLRLRYAKRGRLRFTSHRDIARALERALRRAAVPMAFSAGFSPHPKISWVGAAPTGVASEAEYVEIGLAREVDPEAVRAALDASLPPGLDVLEAVVAPPGTSLADRCVASSWSVVLGGVALADAERAVAAFLSAAEVPVQRLTKDGTRTLDARAAVVSMRATSAEGEQPCAMLSLVVRHLTPAVRPDDVLSGLRETADLATPVAPAATRLAQGPLTATGEVADPLAPDRDALRAERGGGTRQAGGTDEEVAGTEPPVGAAHL